MEDMRYKIKIFVIPDVIRDLREMDYFFWTPQCQKKSGTAVLWQSPIFHASYIPMQAYARNPRQALTARSQTRSRHMEYAGR